MEKFLADLNVRPKICFKIIFLCFFAFVLYCSILYPFTSDEVRSYVNVHTDFIKSLSDMFFNEAPRFLNLVAITGIYLGKYFKVFFCLVNPFIQLFLVYLLFYFIKGRKLNINNQSDILPFLFICLMYLFMIPSPSQTLFWISGALNYSWAFLFCLMVLCLYRFICKGCKLKKSWYINLIWLFIGFVSGMSNENTGPMMLGIAVCFIFLCKYKKIKIPSYVYYTLFGIISGVAVMFGAGGSSKRLSSFVYTFFTDASLGQKLYFSLHRFNKFLQALYFTPVITFIALLLVLYDKKRETFQSEKFILSLFFLICGLILAFVLFAAPLVPDRAYFSAGIFCIISFYFLLDLLKEIYKIYFLKYITLISLVYCLIISPFVLLPYVSLYRNFKARDTQIYMAKRTGKKQVYTDSLLIVPAPTKNLTIRYLDLVKHHSSQHKETLKKWYGIEVIVPEETTFSFTNRNPLIKNNQVLLDKEP